MYIKYMTDEEDIQRTLVERDKLGSSVLALESLAQDFFRLARRLSDEE